MAIKSERVEGEREKGEVGKGWRGMRERERDRKKESNFGVKFRNMM